MSSSWVVLGCSSGTAIPRGARTPVAAPIGIPISRRTFLKSHLDLISSTRGSPLVTRFTFFASRGSPLVTRHHWFACCSGALLASISTMLWCFAGYHLSDSRPSGASLATISLTTNCSGLVAEIVASKAPEQFCRRELVGCLAGWNAGWLVGGQVAGWKR